MPLGRYVRFPIRAVYAMSIVPPMPLSIRLNRSLAISSTADHAEFASIAKNPALSGRLGSRSSRHAHGAPTGIVVFATFVGGGTIHVPNCELEPGLIS